MTNFNKMLLVAGATMLFATPALAAPSATSVTLTIFAAQNAAGSSVADQLGAAPPAVTAPALPEGTGLLPPATAPADTPATPPRVD